MLRFKQFIQLLEAKAMHFQHIPSFDSVEHKDLVDAYNEMNLSTNDAAKIKTLDDLKNKVQPGLEKIKEKAEKEAEKEKFINDAFADGSVEKVYDNPETKVIVYKPHNAKGCRAVQSGIIDTVCVFNPDDKTGPDNETGQDHFDRYDPSGQHSYILHLDKEKEPNYRRIAAIGILPGKAPDGYSFVDKGNNIIPDDDWERLRKEHGLDEIPALNGIRGIPIDKAHRSQELINNLSHGNFSADEISNAKDQGYWDEKVHQPLINAIANHPKSIGAHEWFAIEHKNGRDIGQDAINAIANHPKSTKAHEHLAEAHHEGKRIGQTAIDAIANHPNSAMAHEWLAIEHRFGKNIGKTAIDAIANNPNSIDAHYWLAEAHANKIHIGQDAIDAIVNNPNSAKANEWLTIAHENGRSIGEANYKKLKGKR